MTNPFTRVAIVLNSASGDGAADAARSAIAPVFEAAGISTEFLMLAEGDDLSAILTRVLASGVDAIVAGGGDGTVNSVAAAVVGHDVTVGVIPLGTLNHFARDLGIPLDAADAARVIVAGHTIPVDVAEVNGRIFLNNSSVGLYPRIVQLRERYKARGIEKWIVAAWATFRVTRRSNPLRVLLNVDGKRVSRTTPLVFIGNNEYRMAGFDAGSRASLTDGRLAIYIVATSGQLGFLKLTWRILTGTAHGSGDLLMLRATEATIDVPDEVAMTQLPVALDGEIDSVELPLRYAIRPGALRVAVPR